MPNIQRRERGREVPGSTSPNFGGNARCTAIDSAVRAAGRIVVWQLAAAELSTAMISSLTAIVAEARRCRTRSCRSLDSTSSELFGEEVGALHRLRRERDDHEDRDEDERGEHAGEPGRRVRVLALLVDARGGVPAPVDEHREQQALGERADAAEVASASATTATGWTESVRCAAVDLDQRDQR